MTKIQPHCMGMEFPKRDTDSPNVEWVLPSAADLDAYVDAVAEEQRVKEKTGAKVPNR